jgi:hypothetical protein
VKIGSPRIDEHVLPPVEGIDYLVNVFGLPEEGMFYHCPCCGYPTLQSRGSYEVCLVCFWEDDGQDDHDSGRVRGGPNGSLSLDEAKANYRAFGACEKAMIEKTRSPTDEEMRHRKNDD